jgi:hypothetical protein
MVPVRSFGVSPHHTNISFCFVENVAVNGRSVSLPFSGSYYRGVERLTNADRVCAIAAAAAQDLNDELTILLNGAAGTIEQLEPGHPARPLLFEMREAVQRCVWKTSGLLNYGARRGVRPVPIPMERLMLEAE